jgi:hypothetical protein
MAIFRVAEPASNLCTSDVTSVADDPGSSSVHAQRAGAVGARELPGEVDGGLLVLRLVGSDGDLVGSEGEDVGGHQDRVVVEPDVDAVIAVAAGFGVRGDRGLVGMRPVQQALGRHVAQQRREPRDRGHPALAVDVHVGTLQAACEQRGGQPPRPLRQRRRRGTAVERVQVGDEHVHGAVFLGGEAGQRPDRARVVPEVQIAGRLDARQRRGAAVRRG